ncbi:MAG: hypothetical protein FJW30_01680 [Acidobacteria bacterium]|nr:hypothetical protein [Acidobacteriota bacterium]
MHGHRHPFFVRLTHWLAALALLTLLVTGAAILLSHPRFYWGETGNLNEEPLFTLPLPASRGSVPTGYGFVLADQNGWARSYHFLSAWLIAITGLFYVSLGVASRHVARKLVPNGPPPPGTYNNLQRVTYLLVVFAALPLMIWTGLAMSPAFVAAVPFTATLFGGQQSARTIHFFTTVFLAAFLLVHLVKVYQAGFRSHVTAMIFGTSKESQ